MFIFKLLIMFNLIFILLKFILIAIKNIGIILCITFFLILGVNDEI